tara:strand:+ start:6402 stop:8069 length:1668 start_codon:yes stop_codon:yes gene_type:complete
MLRVSTDMPVSNYSVVIPAENGVSFKENNVIRFRIPQQLGFIDCYTSYLQFDLTLRNNTMKGRLASDSKGNSVIRMLRIMADGHVLEEIDNFNVLADLHSNYGYDLGELELRDVMEGGSGNSSFADGLNNATALTDTSVNNKNVKVCLPLNLSGILGSKQALPLVAMGDVELEITLEEDERAICGIQRQFLSSTYAGQVLANGVPLTNITLLANRQGGTPFGATAARNAEYETDWEQSVDFVAGAVGDDCPWIVGQRIAILRNDGTAIAALADVPITAISYAVPGGGFLDGGIRLTFAGIDPAITATEAFIVKVVKGTSNSTLALSYEVNMPEYVARVVVPPSDYMADLQAQIVNEGYAVDIHTWTTYREHNVSRPAGSASADTIEVPCYGSRAKAVLCVPVSSTNPKNLDNASAVIASGGKFDFKGVFNNFKDYQFQIGEKRVPTRRVSCVPTNYRQEFVSQEQLTELTKALRASGIGVHNLRNYKKDFVIGRSLSAYGGTTDLRMKGLRLYVDGAGVNPDTGVNQTIAEINWYNFVANVKRMVITPAGLEILY